MHIERTPHLTTENPDGLLYVSEDAAIEIGKNRTSSSAGAVGSVVAGPVVAFVTKKGTLPLPESVSEESVGTHLEDVLRHQWDLASKPRVESAKLRSKLTRQYGIRCQSTGNTPDVELTRIIFQTIGVLPENPCLLEFNQLILDPFTGLGQFDLVERDSMRRVFDGASEGATAVLTSETMNWQPGDVDKPIKIGMNPGQFYTILSVEDVDAITLSDIIVLPSIELTLTMVGETETTIATSVGFTDGVTEGVHSRLNKAITSDKVYSVVFVPGTAGDGIFSIKPQALISIPPDKTPVSI